MKNICFVTDEFYPVRRGGIGRVLYNLYNGYKALDVSWHLLLVQFSESECAALAELLGPKVKIRRMVFGGTRLFDLPSYENVENNRTEYRPLLHSQQIMQSLREFEASLPYAFDEIEFPDFRGWALATIQEKQSGIAFQNATLSIRLHSTLGLIDAHETGWLIRSAETAVTKQMERQALAGADRIIAHLAGVVAANRDFYGFGDDWIRRTVVAFPPILPLADTPPKEAINAMARDIVFSARLQPFKRPDLFVKGASEFLDRTPEYRGRIVIACSGWMSDFVAWVLELIPARHAHRFLVLDALPDDERNRVVAGSVFVLPSVYESLCLAIYEASMLGARVVLNGTCIAFGEDSPWRDDENCFLFDGTAGGLADALQRALLTESIKTVPIHPDPPAWGTMLQSGPVELTEPATLSVVVYAGHDAVLLLPLLESLVESGTPLDVVIAWDGVEIENMIDRAALNTVTQYFEAHFPVTVLRLAARTGPAEAINEGLRHCRGQVAMLISDHQIVLSPDLPRAALTAMSRVPLLDLLLPPMGVAQTYDDISVGFSRAILGGLGVAGPLIEVGNFWGGSVMVLRRQSNQGPFHSGLRCFEDLDLLLRWEREGRRISSMNVIGAWQLMDRVSQSDEKVLAVARRWLEDVLQADATVRGVALPSLSENTVQRLCQDHARAHLAASSEASRSLLMGVPVSLEVRPLGDQQPASQGSEVWVESVALGGGLSVPLADLCPDDGRWQLREDGRLMSYGEASPLVWRTAVRKDSERSVVVRFTAHDWSGRVELRWGTVSQIVDLYSERQVSREIVLRLAGALPI